MEAHLCPMMRLVQDEAIPLPRIWAMHEGAHIEADLSAQCRRGRDVAQRAQEPASSRTAGEVRAKETARGNNRQYECGSYARFIGNAMKTKMVD